MKCIITISDMGQTYTKEIERLESMGIEVYWDKDGVRNTRDEQKLIEECKGYDIVIAGNEKWGKTAIDGCADSLKLLVRYGIGYDSVDLAAASAHGIPVTILPGCNADSVAERALALMLAALHRIPEQNNMIAGGTHKIQPFLTRILGGKTVGILGMGNIGRSLIRLLKPFNCKILAFDAYPNAAFAKEYDVELTDMETLIREADVISVHLPMCDETKWTIRTETIEMMKPSAVVINTARGGLVNSDDLAQALRSGRISAAGLDVFENEGANDVYVGHQFMDLKNVALSAHTASNAHETFAHMMDMAIDAVDAWQKGSDPIGLLNPEYKSEV